MGAIASTKRDAKRRQVIAVVAGGPSFSMIDKRPLEQMYVIAVNRAAVQLVQDYDIRPDEIVTMDRLWMENTWKWLCRHEITTFARTAALKNIPDPLPPWVHPFICDHNSAVFGEAEYRAINGKNSGYCGVNRAYHHRPRELHLYGFDMRGSRRRMYWHDPHPWAKPTSGKRFKEWAADFEVAASMLRAVGCEVTLHGDSAITAFGRRA